MARPSRRAPPVTSTAFPASGLASVGIGEL
jgi:hypothetical protein